MIQPKLKGFSFNKGKVIEEVVRIGSSLDFHGERERFVPFLSSSKNSDRVHEHFDLVEVTTWINVYVLAVGSCEGEMSYQYQSVYLWYWRFSLMIIVRDDY